MARRLVIDNALRAFADRYNDWKHTFPFDSEEGREVMVPLKDLRIAAEVLGEYIKKEE